MKIKQKKPFEKGDRSINEKLLLIFAAKIFEVVLIEKETK